MRGTLKHVNRIRRCGKTYYYHRPTNTRLPDDPASPEFLRRLAVLNEQLERKPRADGRGTLNDLIAEYKKSPEFRDRADKTKKDYRRYLDFLGEKFGDVLITRLDREFVIALRDRLQDKRRTANYIIQILRLILNFAGDRPSRFLLPQNWINPALKPNRLPTGPGHRPWEEYEIDAFRQCWAADMLERVLFETFLNTGQRGEDLAPMARYQIQGDMIRLVQRKTGEEVYIPIAKDLNAVLSPWLEKHKGPVVFTTPKGRGLKLDHMRHLMRAAMRKAGLPDDCALHGLRYTFATRADEIGVDWRDVEAIVGHRTAEMARKYRQKKRRSRLTMAKLDQATGGQKKNEPH